MRYLFIILFSFSTITCFGQFEKSITFSATANFNIALKGLALNDAGVGLGLNASIFSKSRLQALLETSADRFIGDKQLHIEQNTGKVAKNAAVYSIRVGPQFFLTRNLAIAATYGPSWHVVRDFEYSLDGGFKFSLTGFLGAKRRFVTRLFFVNIPVEEQPIQYLGIGLGMRF